MYVGSKIVLQDGLVVYDDAGEVLKTIDAEFHVGQFGVLEDAEIRLELENQLLDGQGDRDHDVQEPAAERANAEQDGVKVRKADRQVF